MRVRSAEGGVPVAATLLPCGAAPSASAREARRSPPPEARLCAPPRDHKNIIFCDEELVVEWAQGDHLQIDMLRHVLARKGHHMDEYHLIQRRSAPQQASARWIAENRLGMQEERFDQHKHIGAITHREARFLRYMVVEGARLRAGLGACKTGTHPGRVCFVADASALPTIGPGGSIVRDRVYAAARQVRAHACPQARLPAHSCAPMLAPKPACPRTPPRASGLGAENHHRRLRQADTARPPPLVRCTCPASWARAATTRTRRARWSLGLRAQYRHHGETVPVRHLIRMCSVLSECRPPPATRQNRHSLGGEPKLS